MQEARYNAAMIDLKKAEEELAEKNRELAHAQAKYDAAMQEKQVGYELDKMLKQTMGVKVQSIGFKRKKVF